MTAFRQMITSGSGVSSNRFIYIIMVVWMLLVMTYAMITNNIQIDTLKVVLEYSFYIFVSTLGTKAAEKITGIIKSKSGVQ